MKTGIVKRILGTVTAAAMCLTALPSITASAANVGDKLSVQGSQTQHRGNCDGFSYEVWLDNTGGSGSMTLGKGATFKAEWNAAVSRGNYLARRGLDFGSQKKATDYPYIGMDYEANYNQTNSGGNSRLCVYGWFQNKGVGGNVPLVEYYIIEDWKNWCPGPNGSSKTVTIDGAQYEIFQIDHTGPSINSGNETFKQYFSVRKTKRTSGHITVSDHFKAWAEQGWGIGNLYEVSLNAEGWESAGYADVTKLNVYTDPSQAGQDVSTPITTTPVKPVDPDTNGYYFNSGFESGAGNWEGRGDANVSIDSNNHNGGSKSLFVSGRTDNWHGAQMALDTAAFVPGNTYSFGAAVMQNKDSSTDLKLTLQYKDASGTAQYDEVAIATASKGKWTALSNTAYTIPSGASDLLLYVEAPDSLTDFYVDDIFGATKGKTFTVSGGTTTTDPTDDPTTPVTPPVSDGTGLKGIFAPWFKMGTSVSPNELYTGKDFLIENYNSITPENELKPDSILDQTACQQKGNNVNTQISLSRAANTLKFCEDNGISMRGHTFVWYSQTPDWFFRENFSNNGAYVSKDIMNQRLESMIKNTFAAIKQQYPKLDLYSYDVCNELFLNDGGGLRNAYATQNSGASNWAKIYGEGNDEFIINAFKYARQYAPEGCKLYINDYNEYVPAKTQDIYDIAMKLKGLGYIDGIGMQSHLDTSYPSASLYKTALEKFLSTGLEVQITELDITCTDLTAQANLYEEIFKLAMAHADQIPAFTIWGTTDNVSWRSSQSPLLFSQGYQPKPAYDKVVALAKSTNPPATTTTKPVESTTTTTTTTSTVPGVQVSLWGDANCDKTVNLADAVSILQSIASPDKYALSAQGAANADVNLSGNGISSLDALAIQKYLLGSLTKLPESYDTAATTTVAAPVVTTTVTENTAKEYFNNSFENGAGNWEARGSVTLASSSDSYYSGSKSLKVSGRSDTWNGAAVALSTSEFKPGSTYSFSAAVMQTSGSKQAVNMTLEYKDASGETNYATVAEASAANTEWTKLENTAYKIPSGASDMLLYIELPDSASANIYIDDVVAASEGTKSSVVTGKGVVGSAAKAEAEAPSTNIDASKPMIAISFDDGASPATGTRIVDALAKQGFTATFFYVGNWIRDASGENEVKYAYSKGMEIANHSTSHPDLSTKSSSEIRSEYDQCEAKLKNIIGAQPSKLLRLPYLGCNSTVQQTLYDAPLITCAIDTQDWNGASKDQIVNTIKQAIQSGSGNGAIVLCHETYETTAAAMEELAPWIKAQGWQVVSISEMFAAKGKTLNGGQVYTKCN